MRRFLSRNRQLLTVLLALAGIGITLAYIYCYGACSSLRGDVLGVDLKYLGIFYMSTIIVLALMRKFLLCLLLFAFGAGSELFLIGYQIRSGIYCPYCLAFAATVFLGLAVNFERAKKTLATLAAAGGLVFFLLFFSGTARPVYAAESPLPVFGAGPVQVRIYTDYFCGPCRTEEAEVMSLITELLEKNLVRVTFIDTPIHQETILYAGYFLAMVNANKEFAQAAAARAALFEAAGKKIGEKEAMEAFLKKKGIPFLPFNTAPVFKIYGNYLKEDRINSTPTCVIVGPSGKQTLQGSDQIPKGLRDLLGLPGPASSRREDS
ncbi:MAG: thioredoxin domain-containing protein [Proteobacteria bacterium]|nr:thioredoxin domain-containing protein [Pseudomonadota bacterium]MBU2226440.1 thioredoxin domain-containing protein [Pseudomonadota bacterium]MBU2260443.1 thioredoxin domain-containing protein [Pseudomonadota bacterium]